jgi:response regulator RpfG family c-di-GMP phosphodiesterase
MAAHAETPLSPDTHIRLDRSVLVVDDETGVRDLMSRWLEAGGYDVSSASDADEALDVMESLSPAVALCDIRMPGRDGFWLTDRIRQAHPDTAVIIATGLHDPGVAAASLRHGVVDYLTKPFGRDRLRDAVVRGIEWHRSARDSRSWREKLESELAARHAHLHGVIGRLNVANDESLERMLAVLMMGDPERAAHARRVAVLAVSVAQAMGLPGAEMATIRRAALLHEIGKLAMPEAILRKPAPLSPEEQALVERHPGIAFTLLSSVPFLASVASIVRDTHERPDGLGYPAGIGAPHLTRSALILAVVDAYDTMTRPRIYRDIVDANEGLLELERCSGTQFDPTVVRALKSVMAVH